MMIITISVLVVEIMRCLRKPGKVKQACIIQWQTPHFSSFSIFQFSLIIAINYNSLLILFWWLPIKWERDSNNFISSALHSAICIWSCNLSFFRILFSSTSSWWLLSSTEEFVAFSSEQDFRYEGNTLGSHFFLVISTSICLQPFWNFSCLNSHRFDDIFLNPCLVSSKTD